ncbi:D-glycero-beta-D-manno-heptose 1,7-bisphosphate 7-phosphatase [Marinobacter shengliensis]|uniref:D-glycero-beta-D-manno-heptose 1,7-bisphosphate 7-phosphatase n=1 Tax=Marinobacter shengliensis TaxID=1389223 RepID=UPI001E2A09F4|nr:D-glycero-beta-D-manno-heptose 1,7-bisphosphate 7-phosphatase [Marinobacter shengliensis]MCD1631094.1 D-glycero-beta-D-manno-heptose 1,7-bisphosphate 7-phosphatase [Marinobacter shengliensis]
MTNKAVFLDRDGVINVDHGYVYRKEGFEFVDGIFEACRHFQEQGYLLIVVTNQSGIARGMYSEAQFQELTDWMVERFKEQGVTISRVYHCPHHPDFGPEDERDCDCRKPKPGMILRGIEEFDLDPSECIMIGDKESDMEAAEAANLSGKIMVSERSQSMTKKSKTSFIKTLAELTS